jgi:hypothetical protein
MNSLSWALYAAGTLDSLKIVLMLMAIVFGPVYLIATAFQRGDAYGDDKWPWPKGAFFSAVVMLFIWCAVPSAKTVYMIAASEAGERVANSPEGREMLELLRHRIRDFLSDKA